MSPSAPVSTSPRPGRILLIGWDAADWQMIDPLIEAGKMPHLSRLIDGGVLGNLATLHPIISPMLWTSIATGKLADKHGIHGFTERDPRGGVRFATSTSRRAKTVWNIFQQALGWRCNVVSWWASYPAEPLDGATVSNAFFHSKREGQRWQVSPHAVHPPELAKELLPLLLGINEIDPSLVLPFIPRAAEIDQKTDPRLETFAELLSQCVSVQGVATELMQRAPWDFTAVYFDAIDHFAHGFMPFHPPRMENAPERDFELYQGVMNGVYQFHDMLLGRLVELAGPETTIVLCSDHGFQSGGLRPHGNPREPAGPILWHREFGILVMNGPGIKRDERIYGATLLDLAPTLLTLAGLPVGRDMDGKPLLEAFADPAAPAPIASWEDVPGRDGQHPPGFEPEGGEAESEELLRQFAALGYINDPGEDREKGAADSERESRYNLAAVLLSTGRAAQGAELLEKLVAGYPWESRYIHQLTNAYLKSGQFRAAHDLLDRAYPPDAPDAPPVVVLQMRATARLRLGDRPGATDALLRATRRMLLSSGLWVENGWLWLEMGVLPFAERSFRRAVELDADAAAAFHGLAHIHLRRRENPAAIDAALQAVQRLYHLPRAHLCLGIALARERRDDEALVAFQRTAQMAPHMIDVHRWLAAMYTSRRPDSLRAGVHRNLARRLGSERTQATQAKRARAETRRPIPDLPPTREREKLGEAARPLPGKAGESGQTFVLVSGLPRSGTSLMMQMLAAGGLPPKTDGERTADVDNPGRLPRMGGDQTRGPRAAFARRAGAGAPRHQGGLRAVVRAAAQAPLQGDFHEVGPMEEIVRSQAKMIARRGSNGAEQSGKELAATLQKHRDTTLGELKLDPEVFDLLEVDYPAMVADPASWTQQVAGFVGAELLPQPERMMGVVRGELHRNRSK